MNGEWGYIGVLKWGWGIRVWDKGVGMGGGGMRSGWGSR